MLCQRCGEREAEIFQTQQVGGKSYSRDLCSVCAKVDYGVFLGALLYASGWLYASFAGAAYLPMALIALTGAACAARLLTESPTVQVTPPVVHGP